MQLGADGVDVVAQHDGAAHEAAEARHARAQPVGVGVEHVADEDAPLPAERISTIGAPVAGSRGHESGCCRSWPQSRRREAAGKAVRRCLGRGRAARCGILAVRTRGGRRNVAEARLIVQHEPDDPPGSIAVALAGSACPSRCAVFDLTRPCRCAGRDTAGLISLGGAMHVTQPATSTPSSPTRSSSCAAWSTRARRWGICLGAQLLAEASGGAADKRATPRWVWTKIEKVADDPLLRGISSLFYAFNWMPTPAKISPTSTSWRPVATVCRCSAPAARPGARSSTPRSTPRWRRTGCATPSRSRSTPGRLRGGVAEGDRRAAAADLPGVPRPSHHRELPSRRLPAQAHGPDPYAQRRRRGTPPRAPVLAALGRGLRSSYGVVLEVPCVGEGCVWRGPSLRRRHDDDCDS